MGRENVDFITRHCWVEWASPDLEEYSRNGRRGKESMTSELIVPLEDLRRVSVECDDCQTVMILDAAKGLTPPACPGCHKALHANLVDALDLVSKLYLSNASRALAFRIPVAKT